MGVLDFTECGLLSMREIARKINRSKEVVRNIQKNPDNYGKATLAGSRS